MPLRKNKKFIDPRYFMDEKLETICESQWQDNIDSYENEKYILRVIGIPIIVSPRFSAINMKERLDDQWSAHEDKSELQKWIAALSDEYYLTLVEDRNRENFMGSARGFERESGMDGIRKGIKDWILSVSPQGEMY